MFNDQRFYNSSLPSQLHPYFHNDESQLGFKILSRKLIKPEFLCDILINDEIQWGFKNHFTKFVKTKVWFIMVFSVAQFWKKGWYFDYFSLFPH